MNKYDINHLNGLLLIATHKVGHDPLFSSSLVFITKHDVNLGAEGIIINKPTKLPFYKLFHMVESDIAINLSKQVLEENMVLIGGPELVKSTFVIEDDLSHKVLTETLLESIVSRSDTTRFEVAAGIATWQPGQLEREVFNDFWIPTACDKEIMFKEQYANRYDMLVNKLDLSNYLNRLIADE